MAPLITALSERLEQASQRRWTQLWITAPADSFGSLMTAGNRLSVSRRDVMLATAATRKVEPAAVWRQPIWESAPERVLLRTETGCLLHSMMCKILEVKLYIREVVRNVEESFIKKREHSRQRVHFYCRVMKIARLRVVAGHSTKCCPLIKVWELNQTTRHSYLPIQQLFDSSVRVAARLL